MIAIDEKMKAKDATMQREEITIEETKSQNHTEKSDPLNENSKEDPISGMVVDNVDFNDALVNEKDIKGVHVAECNTLDDASKTELENSPTHLGNVELEANEHEFNNLEVSTKIIENNFADCNEDNNIVCETITDCDNEKIDKSKNEETVKKKGNMLKESKTEVTNTNGYLEDASKDVDKENGIKKTPKDSTTEKTGLVNGFNSTDDADTNADEMLETEIEELAPTSDADSPKNAPLFDVEEVVVEESVISQIENIINEDNQKTQTDVKPAENADQPMVSIDDSKDELTDTKCTQEVKSGQKRTIEENDNDSRQALKRVRIFNCISRRKSSQDSTKEEEVKVIPLLKNLDKCLEEEKCKEKKMENASFPPIDSEQIERLASKELDKLRKQPKINSPKLQRICRKDLESIVVQLFADKLLYEHELGRQRDLCKRLEATLEGNRKKAAQFHKEIDDLEKVTERLQKEYSIRKGQIVTPVKVKRSVGIHVTPNIINKGINSSESVVNNVKYISPSKQKKTEKLQKTELISKATVTNIKDTTILPIPISKTTNNIVQNRLPVTTMAVAVPVGQVTASTNDASVLARSKTGFIDLTDDEEVNKSLLKQTLTNGSSMVAIPRQAINLANSGQFVAVPQSSMNSVLLVPPTAATLVVTSMANNVQNIGAATNIRPPILPANTNPPRLILASTLSGTNPAVIATKVSQAPRHPAALPKAPPQQTAGFTKKLPPQPILNLSHKDNTGIVLLWKMAKTDEHESIASYQLYAYQEGSAPPLSSLWKKVGSVKALELPMACTLTQFMSGHTYHFAVRAVDIRNRLGPFSDPKSIRLKK